MLARCLSAVVRFIFFFQAEDGIRDYKVTGVQTCALPICLARRLVHVHGLWQASPRHPLARPRDDGGVRMRDAPDPADGPRGGALLSRTEIGRASCRERV